VEGAAMGSPVSPIVANLFMEHFEERALISFHSPIKFWGRYVDDTMVVIATSLVDDFTVHLNSLHHKIKFTSETEVNNSIPMLDTLILRRNDGSLDFQVYRKKTHTDHYLQFTSHQPVDHKLGVVRTLRHRANTIISNPELRADEADHIKKALSISGYPRWTWHCKNSHKVPRETSRGPGQPAQKNFITIPYVQGISEPLGRVIRKAGVTVHFRPYYTES